jgi:ketosteroid isomerase-like protein
MSRGSGVSKFQGFKVPGFRGFEVLRFRSFEVPTLRVLAMALLVTALSAVDASAQSAATTPTATSCAQAQAIVDRLLASAASRIEAARLTNAAAQMRAAVDALDSVIRDVRMQLAPCASLESEDPHSGHTATPKTPSPQAGGASHTGHDMTSASTSAPAEILAWLQTFDAAFVAKDLARLAGFYHPDVTIYEGIGVNNGWANYRDTHLGPELESFAGLEFGHTNQTVHMLGDHFAYVTSEFFLKAQMKGKPLDVIGRETLVLQHEDGRWRIRHAQMATRPRNR